jgi:hypothetical protein
MPEMTFDEQHLADDIYEAIQTSMRMSDRSQQQAEWRVGVSDLGWCSEKVRRMLDKQEPDTQPDLLQAFIGTWVGEGVETAVAAYYPDAIIQTEVTLHLVGDGGEYNITGHPDVILPGEGILIDNKTVDGLAVTERTGPNQAKQFQRHCYAKAAHDEGLFGDLPLELVRVANAWVDRAGVDRRVHVQMEPYSQEIVDDAGRWLDDVVYAFTHGEEARKEPAREVCALYCGFYRTCRAYDTDVEGRLTDPDVLTAVDVYQEGLELEREGKRLKDQAKSALQGVSGTTGSFAIRWTHVNESVIKPGVRRGYDKLDIKRLP